MTPAPTAGPTTGLTAVGAAARRLVLVVAAVCLLGTGALDLTPRSLTALTTAVAPAGGSGAVGRPAPARPAAESGTPGAALTLRIALAAAVPGGGAPAALPPGSSPLVAPHLVARPVVRPPAPVHDLGAPGGPSERAPPVPAGT